MWIKGNFYALLEEMPSTAFTENGIAYSQKQPNN